MNESFNDARLDEVSRPTFDRCMTLALAMLEAKPCNADRLHALARLADALACGFDDSKKGDDTRDDLCRRVFGRAALKAKAIIDGKDTGNMTGQQFENIEALASLIDAAANGFKESDEEDEPIDEYSMTGGLH
jgi:hypothetical protein